MDLIKCFGTMTKDRIIQYYQVYQRRMRVNPFKKEYQQRQASSYNATQHGKMAHEIDKDVSYQKEVEQNVPELEDNADKYGDSLEESSQIEGLFSPAEMLSQK